MVVDGLYVKQTGCRMQGREGARLAQGAAALDGSQLKNSTVGASQALPHVLEFFGASPVESCSQGSVRGETDRNRGETDQAGKGEEEEDRMSSSNRRHVVQGSMCEEECCFPPLLSQV